ncbi:hypothetical protein M406DRAFT_285012 [Cryphonectria parasitica EP155]|uniref:RRM domain-containing protein n=1 Tax=Cryphonectria parasitica (strain ATCC 38755 / EP155) TaxID=660469 RepID=A0A9P4YC61_CRYP1|nr:uncharacterized protein M406DRAFT_285012 [Cryphonectria parasitica EP155]KAF3770366.1 hypothetical protein M406DRAFT_285012 [Cryphonectria parasitica EP155]
MAFHPSSPPSEGGADSFKYEDTPDTRLSSFSPTEDSAKASRLLNSMSLSNGTSCAQSVNSDNLIDRNNGASALHRMASMDSIASVIRDKDPFITSPSEKAQSQTKLSATATAFRPLSTTPVVAIGSNNALDTPKPLARSISSGVPVVCSPITGARVYNHVPLSSIISKELNMSRSKLQTLGGPFERYPDIFPCGNVAYLRLTNVRDSPRILNDKTIKPKHWKIEAISAQEINKHFKHWNVFALVKQPSNQPEIIRWVIEMSDCNATYGCASQLYTRGWMAVEGFFLLLLAPLSLGGQAAPLFSLNDYGGSGLRNTTVSDLTAQLDNMSLHRSRHAVQLQEPSTIASVNLGSPVQLTQWPGSWGLSSPMSHLVQPAYPNIMSRAVTPASSSLDLRVMSPMSPAFPMTRSPFSSPLSKSISTRVSFPSPRLAQGFQRSDPRRQNAMRVNRSHFSPPGPHHNHVDIKKIQEGIDVRTTIMLRNIPNKVDQAMLKNIVDESSWGKYDFMYLRIDFANDCNVGYAFINFVDPLDIIDFVNARGNQRWNCFKSDKIAEISYATIQGKDCLVQKFRNSSVMLEAAHYRPKLYYTTNGPTPQMAGQEEPFPEPDNHSKMKRSCENAEHVGLFTPNAGQNFREEQRRRRSQYDRGTRLAALEECGEAGLFAHPDLIR